MPLKAIVLAIVFSFVYGANLPAAAQDPAGTDALTAFMEEMFRQADEFTKMATGAQNRTGKTSAGGQIKSLTVIGKQTNIAVGAGSIACTSIGGVNQEPTCVTGSDNMTAERKIQ